MSDGKSDIQIELERQGFRIHTLYDEHSIPVGAYVTRGKYRSTGAQSWQQLRDIIQEDGEWDAARGEG